MISLLGMGICAIEFVKACRHTYSTPERMAQTRAAGVQKNRMFEHPIA